jgi:hypothetical protein
MAIPSSEGILRDQFCLGNILQAVQCASPACSAEASALIPLASMLLQVYRIRCSRLLSRCNTVVPCHRRIVGNAAPNLPSRSYYAALSPNGHSWPKFCNILLFPPRDTDDLFAKKIVAVFSEPSSPSIDVAWSTLHHGTARKSFVVDGNLRSFYGLTPARRVAFLPALPQSNTVKATPYLCLVQSCQDPHHTKPPDQKMDVNRARRSLLARASLGTLATYCVVLWFVFVHNSGFARIFWVGNTT